MKADESLKDIFFCESSVQIGVGHVRMLVN